MGYRFALFVLLDEFTVLRDIFEEIFGYIGIFLYLCNMKDFRELVLRRRSIRKYEDKPVEREKIEQILEIALASPSGKHINPWEFVVVEDHDALVQMSSCRTYGSQMLASAPLGIVIALDTAKADTWQCDGAIAAMDILLAVEALGLGACWMQVYGRKDENDEPAEDMIKRLTNMPEHLTVLCVIAIGYKGEEKKPINPEKLQYEKIHWGKFN